MKDLRFSQGHKLSPQRTDPTAICISSRQTPTSCHSLSLKLNTTRTSPTMNPHQHAFSHHSPFQDGWGAPHHAQQPNLTQHHPQQQQQQQQQLHPGAAAHYNNRPPANSNASQTASLASGLTPSSSDHRAASLASADGNMSDDDRRTLEYIAQLLNPVQRETALLELSKKREQVTELALVLWHSFGM
jgi:CCR4-NOT transcription complex subunit 9